MPRRPVGGTAVTTGRAAPRVVSLVPGATEMLLALEAPSVLVGRSHECDHPAAAARAAVLTSAPALPGSSAEIDAAVASGQSLPRLDRELLRRLAPDLVLVQDLCGSCAPGAVEVAEACGPNTELLRLSPMRLDDVVETAVEIGEAIGAPGAGRRLAARLRARIDACRDSAGASPLVRTVCLEWLAPLYRSGHWIPDQVSAAGGDELLGVAGTPARSIEAIDLATASPDLVVLMPCGWGPEAASAAARRDGVTDVLARLPNQPRVVVADANAHFSRPGPRLVDGVEWLSATFRATRRVGSTAPVLR